VPIKTKIARISVAGISIGRPAIAAPATARIEPESLPAGTPTSPSALPPIAAIASVSERRRRATKPGLEGVADKAGLSASRTHLHRGSFSEINAVQSRLRQIPLTAENQGIAALSPCTGPSAGTQVGCSNIHRTGKIITGRD
jgi:hypothetical protein